MKELMGEYMQMMSYHWILKNDRSLMEKIDDSYFSNIVLKKCYNVAKEYVLKYNGAPTKEELIEELKRTSEIDDIFESQINAIYAQEKDLLTMGDEYIRTAIINTATWVNTVDSMVRAVEYIRQHDDTVRENPDMSPVFRERVLGMLQQSMTVNYNEEETRGSDFWMAESHVQSKLSKRTTGYKFLDMCMDGGYWDGSFTIFAGAPKVGKSQFLCNLCAESVKNGYNSIYITLELPEEMVVKRIGANIFGIPVITYDEVSNTPKMVKVIQDFNKNRLKPVGQLVIKSFPTSGMTAEDMESWILKEEILRSTPEKPFKFHNIFVDYINIMKNPNNEYTENTYIKIKNIAEHLRGVGERNKWAIISATQTNKSQYDASDIDAKDVAESSGLGATVDMMFGIIRDTACLANNQYYIKCIYDRVAPHMGDKKKYLFDGVHLRLTEDPNSNVITIEQQQMAVIRDAVASTSKKAASGLNPASVNTDSIQKNVNYTQPHVMTANKDLLEGSDDEKNNSVIPSLRYGDPKYTVDNENIGLAYVPPKIEDYMYDDVDSSLMNNKNGLNVR